MAQLQRDLVETLLDSDEEYRKLREEHRTCEARLQEIYARSFLSDEDQIETTRIKKKKLYLKDRMQAIAQSRRGEARP